MELRFLGRGSAFCPVEGNTCAFLREGKRLLLIDCGETVFGRLMASGMLDGLESLTVLITHLHADHVGSLATLASYCNYVLHFPLHIALPGNEKYCAAVRGLLALMGALDCCTFFTANEIKGFESFSGVQYVRTEHAPDLDCYSLIFNTAGGDVFYSGDTRTTAQLETFLAGHPAFETIYVEASLDKSPASVHLPLSALCKLIPREKRARVFVMHLASMKVAEEAAREGFQVVPLVHPF